MGMAMLRLKPGVNAEVTPSQLEAGYAQANQIRYRNGLAEKLGGWEKYYGFAVGGVPKCLHAWVDLGNDENLGIGSTTLLGVLSDGNLTSLTPQTKTTNGATFTTTNGSANVTVTDASILNVTTYDSIEFLTPVAIGGLILSGLYPINLVLGATQFRIVASSNATSSAGPAGTVPSFNTLNASQSLTVTLAAHGLVAGDTINFPIPTTVGGVSIDGTYTVLTVATANTFEISVTALATSTTSGSMNSGQARLTYYIAIGPVVAATGYGILGYGDGGYGTGSAVSVQTGTNITATDWSIDNWGQTLIAVPEGGGIYAWTPNRGFNNAILVSGSGAPLYNTGAFVSMQTQMLICYGSTEDQNIGIDQDPLLVKWSAQGDYTDFTISTTTQAGSRRLPQGSKIVGGMSVPQSELLWTDVDLWQMNYLGSLAAGVWGFNKIGSNCGLIGKHAAVRQGSNVYWMGTSNFWQTGGAAPTVIPCTVWDSVFQDMNTTYQHKCWAWSNTPFNEVWFFFPRASTSATEPDAYVKYNVREQLWDNTIETFNRTCGIDQSLLGMPIAATSAGILYEHEVSPDADGQPLNAYFVTGLYQLSEGNEIQFLDWIIPDMKFETVDGSVAASIQLTLYSYYYPGDTPQTHGPYTFSSTTQYINLRLRGRLISLKIESNDVGTWWRTGGVRARVAQDGRR